MDCLNHESQNASDDGLNYEAGLSYLMGSEEPIQISNLAQAPFVWDGLDHVRLTGQEGPVAGQFTNTWRSRLTHAVLSNSI
jgi:hypothetical protein